MTPSAPPLELARRVELAEAHARADRARAAPAAFGMAVDESVHAVALYAPSIDHYLFNCVLGLGLAEPADETRTAELLARYRAAGLTRYGVAWSPMAQPGDFPEALGRLGLAPRDAWCKMWRDAHPPAPAPSDLTVEPVAAQHAARFGEVGCAGFGLPAGLAPLLSVLVGRAGWHTYLAWDGAAPVACGALFTAGEVGWLGVAATLPAARRRGAQSALLARRVADGAALGCTLFTTETGAERPDHPEHPDRPDRPVRPNPSLHNMRRAGFELLYERANWLPPAAGA